MEKDAKFETSTDPIIRNMVVTRDLLVPEFDSSNRKSSLVVATFNLCATIIGGGVLSLPLAFAKCGLVLGTVLMIAGAIVTERSLYLLCLCSRITGATTYGEVGKAAFGKYMEYCISLLLFTFLMFVLTGYMVLLQDIWTSIVEIVFHVDNVGRVWVLLTLVLLMCPFLVQKSLHALRFNCYVGFGAVSVLCVALCHHALTTPLPKKLRLWSGNWNDILFSFPIIVLSFLSIFNVLPIQGALNRPTRTRILVVVDGAVCSCFALTLLFGAAGYLYAGADTDGNILQNCDHHADWMFFLGRIGCGITIMLAMAMMLLPCRASLLEVIDVFVNGPHMVPVEEEIPLVANNDNKVNHPNVNQRKRNNIADSPWAHFSATFAIASTCFVAAVKVPGVAVVWSLCGSFMSFTIAFLLPAVCYLEIQKSYPSNEHCGWIWFSWFLLVSSVIASVACTVHTLIEYIL